MNEDDKDDIFNDYNDTLDDIPPCVYGDKCYRKNPEHFKLFSHPRSSSSSSSLSLTRSDTWPATPLPPSSSSSSFSSSFSSAPVLKVPNSAPASFHPSALADHETEQQAHKKRKIEQKSKSKLYLNKYIFIKNEKSFFKKLFIYLFIR